MTKQQKQDAAKEQWRKKVYNKADKIDPEDQYTWKGVAIGFFIGCGFSVEDAIELSGQVSL